MCGEDSQRPDSYSRNIVHVGKTEKYACGSCFKLRTWAISPSTGWKGLVIRKLGIASGLESDLSQQSRTWVGIRVPWRAWEHIWPSPTPRVSDLMGLR